MFTLLTLMLSVGVCFSTPITEEQLRSLLTASLANQNPSAMSPVATSDATVSPPPASDAMNSAAPAPDATNAAAQSSDAANAAALASDMTLFDSLAAVSPLATLNFDLPLNAGQQLSPANQQLAQLNLAGGLTNLIKNALGALRPKAEPTTPTPPVVDPILGGMYPNNGGFQQPTANNMPARRMNMFNPLSFLFPGMGGGSPFGMFMPSLMMRMMETFMEGFF